ncbi:glycoside hydrolase family 3 N-terminal domain-containing protein [Anaerobium acetethylicum]|uniref:beta-glucosidase n=1 Tax=Anaerobium acetethylicum TaxID=1619234 RepID=A0A1D3TWN4_9FIRM|nr:glycoside hydrolase family 3 N-terminal domain-containing protein [Anaerobium acetethylicum]SCP98686.1 beta-glucosidase [Anaerobium acetethylicum]
MKKYEDRIKELIARMTQEEKVGQLQQCGPSLVGAFEVSFEELLDMMFDGRISQEEFGRLMSTAEEDFHDEDLKAGNIGSYNGIKNAKTANRLQEIAVKETRLGIPLIFGYDVIHGYKTIMPIPLAEACAWEPELWEKTARVAAKEATAAGVHMTFAPMVDVAKDARWGRVSEGAGEDTFLTSKFGEAKVKGFQGNDLSKEDSMAACVKHFAAYGAAEAGRDYNRVDLSMQKLHEEYLPPFEACVKAGARGIMPAFNDINGVPCSVNKWLLTDLLRDTWGFDGMTVSDANAIAECVNHGIAEDKEEASQKAIIAGMEMDMSSNSYIENLKDLVESGQVEEAILDKAVADVLRVKFELGLFENPYQTSEEREQEELLKPEYRSLARETAGKSMVLLKNEGILPLKRGIKVGIVGDLADNRGEMTGAWAIGADGNTCVSIVDACKGQNVAYTYTAGHTEKQVDPLELLKATDGCDVLIAAIGEVKDQSGEAASRADITIPEYQKEILEALLTTGKPVVAVLFNGRPLAMPWVAENIPAILEAWHPGIEAGNAILDILFGDVNPSGKLTTTFPYATGQCPIYYAAINTGRPGGKGKFTSKYLDTPLAPVYPFGYGLSYTTFAYSNLTVVEKEEGFAASVEVENTGDRDGDEIVQCYVRDLVARRARPVKQLKAFEKVFIKAGEKKTVTFEVPYRELGYYDMNMEYIVEEGIFEIFVGKNSAECLKDMIEL